MTFFSYKEGEEVESLLGKALEHYKQEKEALLLKVDSNVSKFKEILKAPSSSNYLVWGSGYHSSSLAHGGSGWFKTKPYYGDEKLLDTRAELDKRKEHIVSLIDKYIADCTAVYEQNIPIIEHNKAIHTKVRALMQEVGIPTTYSKSYFKTNRSRTRTIETKAAGYIDDLNRMVHTSQTAIPTKENLIYSMQQQYDIALKEIVVKERQAEEEEKKKQEIHKVALLRAKYTPDNASSSLSEIYQAAAIRGAEAEDASVMEDLITLENALGLNEDDE